MSAKHKFISKQDQLERENARLQGDLLTIGSRISHDLRTPLGSILSTGELLREILSEKDPSSVALTDALFKSVDEMTRLIKCVSLIAKASANPVPKERIKMEGIVLGTLQRLESRMLKRGATMDLPNFWPEVEGVVPWLEFIWWSFLVNALQHGGQKIQLGWVQETDGCRFWISDNGPGVPVHLQAKLFKTFDLLHEPDSPSGLGLSIVQRLVELQGGFCGHEISPEGRSVFYFKLLVSEA